MALAGVGGLEMPLGELLTVRQLKLPVKLVVFQQLVFEFRGVGDEGGRVRQLRY
ncbi:hypothetical protein [Streptomyces sp. NPDC058045]|uniref:hypothetical protein n=1 Tax=Streptomyces sp. NPDC058045 TaxID=3346311 RepID=UPI0036E06254